MINCEIDGVEQAYQVDHLQDVRLENVKINGQEIKALKHEK